MCFHELGHLGTSPKLINKLLIQPGLIDFEFRISQKTVAIKTLDIVAFVCTAITPDVDIILFHGTNEHRPGDRPSERGSVKIGYPCCGDMECTTLDGGNSLGDELLAAVDEPCIFCAIGQRLPGDVLVI